MVQLTAKIGIGSMKCTVPCAPCCRADGEEGTDLEAALARIGVDLEIVVLEQCIAIVVAPFAMKSWSHSQLIFPESGVAGQCEIPPYR